MKLEETISGSGHKIDREAGIIRDVKVLGLSSENGYRYTESAAERAVPLYEGKPCYVDHWKKHDDRPTRDHFGELRNVRYVKGEGVYADLHYLKSHPEALTILERAERMPNQFGLSHVADGDKEQNGRDVAVTRITAVESVDIVSRPATNKSIFESEDNSKMTKKSIKQILESASKSNLKKLLREAVDEEMLTEETMIDTPEEASPEDQIKAGLRAAIIGKIDTASADEMKKILKIFGIGDSLSDTVGGGSEHTEESDEEPTTDEDKRVEESVRKMQQKMALMESKNLLLESGREAKEEWVRALSRETTERDRQRLLGSFPKKSSGRPDRSPGRFSESVDAEETEYDRLSSSQKLWG